MKLCSYIVPNKDFPLSKENVSHPVRSYLNLTWTEIKCQHINSDHRRAWSRCDCNIMAALTLSICSFFRRSFFFIPPCTRACRAIFEVNRSSIKTTGISGNFFSNVFTNDLTSSVACVSSSFNLLGSPTISFST